DAARRRAAAVRSARVVHPAPPRLPGADHRDHTGSARDHPRRPRARAAAGDPGARSTGQAAGSSAVSTARSRRRRRASARVRPLRHLQRKVTVMLRVSIVFAIATSLWWSHPRRAEADDAAPSPASRPSKADVDAAMVRFNNGKQMIARGDYAHAITEIELAYALDPRSEHLFNLAVAYQNNAQRDKAIEYYRRYLGAAPDGKLAPDAERYLYKLEAETANERSDQARADATTALAEAMAARADATGARTEANAIRARADQAEKALETERLHRTALEA